MLTDMAAVESSCTSLSKKKTPNDIATSGPSLTKETNPSKNPLNPLNTIRTKIIYEGKHYQCTKAELNKTRNMVIRNYSCQMIKRCNVGGEWVVGTANKTPKTRGNTDYETCKGLLKGYFKAKDSWFEILKNHTCFECQPKSHSVLIDWGTSIAMIGMNPNFNITSQQLTDIKQWLQTITDTHWTPLKNCGRDQMYLPGLETRPHLTEIRNQIRQLIEPIVLH
jgi:hypothetical protein